MTHRIIADHYVEDGTGTQDLAPMSVLLSQGAPVIALSDGTFMDHSGCTWDYWELKLPLTVLWEPAP